MSFILLFVVVFFCILVEYGPDCAKLKRKLWQKLERDLKLKWGQDIVLTNENGIPINHPRMGPVILNQQAENNQDGATDLIKDIRFKLEVFNMKNRVLTPRR